ncbi:MAG: ATP-binding protein, partial [Rhodothermales bacterium]
NPPEAVSMATLAHEAVDLLAVHIEEREVQVIVSPDMPVVFGDRIRLLEVLQNLIDNAIKFMGDQPRPRVEVNIRDDNGETVFFVRDNGQGIAPRYHDKVFGLFERLASHNEGTGIGLALVKRIVEVHEGRIWIESDGPGTGCTFCFTLPLAAEQEPDAPSG